MSLAQADRFESNNNNNNGSAVTNGTTATNKHIKLLCKRNITFDGNGTCINKVARRQNENGAESEPETEVEKQQQKQLQNGEDWHPTNGTRYLNIHLFSSKENIGK